MYIAFDKLNVPARLGHSEMIWYEMRWMYEYETMMLVMVMKYWEREG